MAQSHDETTRRVEFQPLGSETVRGFIAEVVLTHWDHEYGQKRPQGEETAGKYAFGRVFESAADEVRGMDSLDMDGQTYAYCGSIVGQRFWSSEDHESVPVDVFEEIQDRGFLLVEGVSGGWADWDGRPEWSESYIDVSGAEPVDVEGIISERRDDR